MTFTSIQIMVHSEPFVKREWKRTAMLLVEGQEAKGFEVAEDEAVPLRPLRRLRHVLPQSGVILSSSTHLYS